jgi:endonuclease/exonuclease/phosphatase family metal-dependent hydrolase
VSVNWLSDVEAPAYQGSIADPQNLQDPRDVRLTMRDVILKRVGSPVRILGAHEREYDAGLAIDIAGKSLDFTRGYQWVDARVGWHRFRFVNTHLEAFSSDTAYAQAEELLAGEGATRRTTIMVGDFNSDPVDGSIKTAIGDTKRHWAPYYLIKRRGELHDTWLRWAPPEDGWTSGLSETVDDTDASGFDHRIDFVFARTGDGDPLRVKDGEVTGDEVGDRDPATGLWPSDHAGVVMKLQLR